MKTANEPGFFAAANRFFFAPSDTATFGLIRVCAALMALYIHAVYSFDLQELFGADAWFSLADVTAFRKELPIDRVVTDWRTTRERQREALALPLPEDPAELEAVSKYRAKWGHDPRLLLDRGQYMWSAWFHVTDPRTMAVVHAAALVVMALFTLGVWTPVTGVATWLAALGYVNRSHVSLFGMDTMMIIALTYLAVGYLGARPAATALSLDRLLWRRRAARAGFKDAGDADTTSATVTFATRMLQIHFCIIYLAAGASKLLGPAWWNGTALWYTMANYSFAPMDLQKYNELLLAICRYRWVWELVTTGGAVFTLTMEIGLPFLIWHRRTRWVMVVGAVLFHTGIALIMGLTGFGVMMLTLLLSFVPPETVRQVLGLTAERAPGVRAVATGSAA